MQDLNEMDLKGSLPTSIKNLLTESVFNTHVRNTLSDLHNQEMGVAQGSIF